jgi:dGTP triphosphohydrolase
LLKEKCKTAWPTWAKVSSRIQPSLEAQIVNLADEIAYCHHDIDDGFRSKILDLRIYEELDLFNESYEIVKKHTLNH